MILINVLADVHTDVHTDIHTDTYADVHMDVPTDVYTESRNALDAFKSKISPLRFRCAEREACSSNIRRVMDGTVK